MEAWRQKHRLATVHGQTDKALRYCNDSPGAVDDGTLRQPVVPPVNPNIRRGVHMHTRSEEKVLPILVRTLAHTALTHHKELNETAAAAVACSTFHGKALRNRVLVTPDNIQIFHSPDAILVAHETVLIESPIGRGLLLSGHQFINVSCLPCTRSCGHNSHLILPRCRGDRTGRNQRKICICWRDSTTSIVLQWQWYLQRSTQIAKTSGQC